MERSTRVPIGLRCPTPSPASIQIWSLGRLPDPTNPGLHVRGEMMICIDQGCALQIKWCPLPSHDEVGPFVITYSYPNRVRLAENEIGALGSSNHGWQCQYIRSPRCGIHGYQQKSICARIRVRYGVHPHQFASLWIAVKCDPIVRLSLPDTTCNTLDWANSELIAVGCADGKELLTCL
jgi:transcription factor C subunit 6